jgi:hypothetical protein
MAQACTYRTEQLPHAPLRLLLGVTQSIPPVLLLPPFLAMLANMPQILLLLPLLCHSRAQFALLVLIALQLEAVLHFSLRRCCATIRTC